MDVQETECDALPFAFGRCTDSGSDEHGRALAVYAARMHGGEPVYAVAASPREPSLLVSAGGDDRAVLFRLLDAEVEGDPDAKLALEVVAPLLGAEDTVEHVVFSPDGRFVATGALDGCVRVYRTSAVAGAAEVASEPVAVLAASSGGDEARGVDWLAWPAPTLLSAAFADGTLWVWEMRSAGFVAQAVLTGAARRWTCGAFSRDASAVLAGGNDGIAVVFAHDRAAGTWRQTQMYAPGRGARLSDADVIAACVLADGRTGLLGYADGAAALVSLAVAKVLSYVAAPAGGAEAGIEAVGATSDGVFLFAAGLDGALRTWTSAAGDLARGGRTGWSAGASVTAAHALGTGALVAAGTTAGTVGVWDARRALLIGRWDVPAPEANSADDEMALGSGPGDGAGDSINAGDHGKDVDSGAEDADMALDDASMDASAGEDEMQADDYAPDAHDDQDSTVYALAEARTHAARWLVSAADDGLVRIHELRV